MLIYGAQQQSWDVNGISDGFMEYSGTIDGLMEYDWNIDGPNNRLVGGLETWIVCFHILGMSSSQVTNSYFSEELKPPTRYEWDWNEWKLQIEIRSLSCVVHKDPPQMKRPAVPRPTHRNWFSGVILTMLPQFVNAFCLFLTPISPWFMVDEYLYLRWCPCELFTLSWRLANLVKSGLWEI